MISIQVSVQQHTATALPSMIQAHIKLGGRCGSSAVATPPPQPNMPLTDYLEPEGKLPALVDPVLSAFALEQRLLSLRSLKRSSSDDVDCLIPPPSKRVRTSCSTPSLAFPALMDLPLPTPVVTKKTVRFSAEQQQQPEIIPADDQHEYDCEARWYSRAEYNSFRQDMRQNFFLHSMYMRRRHSIPKCSTHHQYESTPNPPKDLCIRGLEKFCFHGAAAADGAKDARKLRLQAVLDQQGVQKALGNANDVMAIRVVAELHSQKSCQQARERAADDFRAVLYGWSRKSI